MDEKNPYDAPIASTPEATGSDETLSVTEKVGYGLGDTASNLYWKIFENFLLYFYTDVFGISAKAAGTMLLVTKIWDAINDPMIGYIADRTKTAWGRFRPYLVWMCVPFAITGVFTFYTPDLSVNGKVIYAYVTYTLVMMAYTAINIPYGALMGVISTSSAERTSVSTYRFVAAFAGGIIVQYFTLSLVAWFGGGTETILVNGVAKETVINEQAGFFWTMVVFSIAAVAMFLITFITTKERVQPEVDQASTVKQDMRFLLTSVKLHQIFLIGVVLLAGLSTGFDISSMTWVLIVYGILSAISAGCHFFYSKKQDPIPIQSTLELDVNDLLSNRPWIVLFGFGLFQLMAAFIRGGAVLFYFKYYVGDASFAPAFWVSGSIAAIVGMLLTRRLTALFGKKMLMIYMNVGTAIFTALFFLASPEQTNLMYGLNIVGAFISGPSPVLLWAMYADGADYSEWKHQRRATGLVFSAATFSQKLGCAVGAAMSGWVLGWYQYQAPVDGVEILQSDLTLSGLRMMMSLIPAGMLLVAAASLIFYNIDEPLLKQIETDLHERKSTTTEKE